MGKARIGRRVLPGPPPGPSGFVSLAMLHTPGKPPQPREEDGGPCHLCNASCCRYFALEIDKPKTKQEIDHIRWYLVHEGVAVWVDDGDWYLEVRTVCRHLQHDNSCGIYETRPQICRDYGLPGEDACEFFTQDLEYDLYFADDAAFDRWVEERRKKKKAKKKAKKKKKSKAA